MWWPGRGEAAFEREKVGVSVATPPPELLPHAAPGRAAANVQPGDVIRQPQSSLGPTFCSWARAVARARRCRCNLHASVVAVQAAGGIVAGGVPVAILLDKLTAVEKAQQNTLTSLARLEAEMKAGQARLGARMDALLAEMRSLLSPLSTDTASAQGAQQQEAQTPQHPSGAPLAQVRRSPRGASMGRHVPCSPRSSLGGAACWGGPPLCATCAAIRLGSHAW